MKVHKEYIKKGHINIRFSAVMVALCLFTTLIVFNSCKKLVEVDGPVTSINSANVYNSDENASAVLTGIYATIQLQGIRGEGIASMTLLPALSADELILYGGITNTEKQYLPYYQNALNSINQIAITNDFYALIYTINSAIEGLNNSPRISPNVKKQLLGEAKFMRSFCYFYLVNLYGDVPLVLTTDYKLNTTLAKSAKDKVYQQIIFDLKDAQDFLSEKYVKSDASTPYSPGTEERVRPTKWAATALLARVYLFIGKWVDAEREASSVIDQSSLFQLTSLKQTFLKNNSESIWQLQPVVALANTTDAISFVLSPSGPSTTGQNLFHLNHFMVDSFESNDLRKREWVNSVAVKGITYYYPFKYKIIDPNAALSEYTVVLRLAEQYLIRAEARIQMENIENGISDINLIRKRATDETPGAIQLPQLSTNLKKDEALNAVLHERQVELFMEWGHRWFDLKRTKSIDNVMTKVTQEKGGTWNTNWQLYPFWRIDLTRNPNLVQNVGY